MRPWLPVPRVMAIESSQNGMDDVERHHLHYLWRRRTKPSLRHLSKLPVADGILDHDLDRLDARGTAHLSPEVRICLVCLE